MANAAVKEPNGGLPISVGQLWATSAAPANANSIKSSILTAPGSSDGAKATTPKVRRKMRAGTMRERRCLYTKSMPTGKVHVTRVPAIDLRFCDFAS